MIFVQIGENMQTTKTLSRIFIFVGAMIFLSGCSVPKETVETINTPTLTKPTVEVIAPTPSSTPELVPSATNTALPDTPTFTLEPSQTATSEPTWTPVPTLSPDTKKMNLTDLFVTNGGCDWPCWWGIQPDDSLQDALALSSVLGEAPYIYMNQYSYAVSFDELNLPDLVVTFYERNQIIQYTSVRLQFPSRHTHYLVSFENALSFRSILSKYGAPSDILLQVMSRDGLTYTMVLLYESEGFAIEYYGIVTTDEPVQICVWLADYHLEVIQLYFEDAAAMRSLRDDLFSDEYQHLEDVTAMNIDAFYETFLSSERPACIETSRERWE